jgi:hypothetical protein
MTKQAEDALARWIAESVKPVPTATIRREAERLATEFRAYAADAGINLERLEEDIGEDLVTRMVEALEEAAEAEDQARDTE